MYSLCFLAIVSGLLCLVLTPLTRNWSVRMGILDLPCEARKIHGSAMPRTGGIPILISYLGAYGCLALVTGTSLVTGKLATLASLFPAIALVFVTGLLDDWLSLRPWQKLSGQVAGALLAYEAGVRISSVAGHSAPPWLSLVMTVGWLVLCSNAFNLIDGVDGLATGVGLAATLTTLIRGLLQGDVMLALATAPLAGALAGFLVYNFDPASIFLGDSGSLLLGFLLGSYGIIWSQRASSVLGMAAPIMALTLPLLEVCLSISRRFLASEPIFEGDRGHIHHRLLDLGLTQRRVSLVLYGACGVAAVFALLSAVVRHRYGGAVVVVFGLTTWLGVHCLRYVEFEAAGRFLRNKLRPMLRGHVQLERLERSLGNARSVDQCWRAIEGTALALGYSHVTAKLSGTKFDTDPGCARKGLYWQMRVNLPGGDYVNVSQHPDTPEYPVLLIPFVEVLGRILPPKLERMYAQPVSDPPKASTTTVISSDWGAPSVNAATPS